MNASVVTGMGRPAVGDKLRPHSASISVKHLSKVYRAYDHALDTLKELVFGKQLHREFWALRDVSFDVREGEIVGLVGANGAGKSTLLRILAGVLNATSGQFTIDGQLRAILELGTGFQDQYTGRENVFVGGACLGYSRQEIESAFDWIVDFAELRHVIDQPFRTYSSGMKSRLTFAVTFFKKPEVMIIDEALSVGDVGFSNKAVNRIIELCQDGATALVVSHNMYLVERLCHRALHLKDGEIVMDGLPGEVARCYEGELLRQFDERNQHLRTATAPAAVQTTAGCSGDGCSHEELERLFSDPDKSPEVLHLNLVRLVSVHILDGQNQRRNHFHVGEAVRMQITLDSQVQIDDMDVGVQIFHENGTHVVTSTNRYHLDEAGHARRHVFNLCRGVQTFAVDFPGLFLGSGNYFINVGVSPDGTKHFSETNLLMLEKRCAVMGFTRDGAGQLLYEPVSQWSRLSQGNDVQ